MRNERAIYDPEYVEISVTTAAGTETFNFTNHDIRKDVEYFDGKSTETFKSPTGDVTGMAQLLPEYFKFTIRYYENEDTRANVQRLKELTAQRYRATFKLKAFRASFTNFPISVASASDQVRTIEAEFDAAIFEIPDDPIDNTARGQGATLGETEIIVYRNVQSFTLPDAPPRILLGIGDYTDLPNFDDFTDGEQLADCFVRVHGALLNTRGDLLPPQAGAKLILYFYDCNDSSGAGGAGKPASTSPVEFDYSADINLATATPSGGDATAITYFNANIKPYLVGGTGSHALDGVANSGELTMTLEVPAFRLGGAGNIQLCVKAEVELTGGLTSNTGFSNFATQNPTATMTVDDDDLKAIIVQMTGSACGIDLGADATTVFAVGFSARDPLRPTVADEQLFEVRFNGGNGANTLTFLYVYGFTAADKVAIEAAFDGLPSGATRGFVYDKQALHRALVGFSFVENENFTTAANSTGTNYLAAMGYRRDALADGSVIQEGAQNYLFGYVIYSGRLSNNAQAHLVRKGFERVKTCFPALISRGFSSAFASDEIRWGVNTYGITPTSTFPTGTLPGGVPNGGTEWFNLDPVNSEYEVDGVTISYNGASTFILTGQGPNEEAITLSVFLKGGLSSKIQAIFQPGSTLNGSFNSNPSWSPHFTECIPRDNDIRLAFRAIKTGAMSNLENLEVTFKERFTAAVDSIDTVGDLSANLSVRYFNALTNKAYCKAYEAVMTFDYEAVSYTSQFEFRVEETF